MCAVVYISRYVKILIPLWNKTLPQLSDLQCRTATSKTIFDCHIDKFYLKSKQDLNSFKKKRSKH